MPSVFHVLHDTNVGGAGIFLLNLITAMPDNEYRHTVLLPKGSALVPRLCRAGVSVTALPITPDASFSPRDVLYLSRFFARRPSACIHTHGSLSARLAARLAGRTPVITTRHCTWHDVAQFHGMKKLLSPACVGLSDLYVATAEAAVRDLTLLSVPRHKIRVIQNGSPEKPRPAKEAVAEAAARAGIEPRDFVVTMTCRLSPEKGCDTLLSAARILLETDQSYRFLFIGDGPDRRRLLSLSEDYGIKDAVRFIGYTEDTSPFLAISNIAVNCSRGTETSSLALSEAMCASLPLIASDFGGNPQMVTHGENGYLFQTDSPPALAAAIARLKKSPFTYAAMSLASRGRYLRDFTAEAMSRRYLSLYRSLPSCIF